MASNQSFMAHEDLSLDAALGFADVFIDDVSDIAIANGGGINCCVVHGAALLVLRCWFILNSVAGCWGLGNWGWVTLLETGCGGRSSSPRA